MASTIRLELVTPERLLLSEEVDEVVAPGYEGEFGVLPEHTQFLAILNIGVLWYRKESAVEKIALGGGFAEVTPDRIVVMADTAERADEIDLERAQRARDRAEARLKELSLDDETHAKVRAALQRALVRMAAGGGE
ncbi:MAG: ATP synthase F1 subunit epsilon [Deltaproteobacteria bacterium 37-65-8]|nr:F0F1 ATP synthase subunit epsilon [Deltaproteobacteria bacterium]OYV99128.1 MAG: ATP synthase F1 subunit epsilon [Deltaproteobacteria bacterium 37-65-8]HQT98262.1 F0F1 ATP synthase subunit epsilon [Thermodesulfobacteriota bacterium]HQU13512.1 F0F1 ATP synthase subunit epsilon [Thermodesulfobacteriota bacterium]